MLLEVGLGAVAVDDELVSDTERVRHRNRPTAAAPQLSIS